MGNLRIVASLALAVATLAPSAARAEPGAFAYAAQQRGAWGVWRRVDGTRRVTVTFLVEHRPSTVAGLTPSGPVIGSGRSDEASLVVQSCRGSLCDESRWSAEVAHGLIVDPLAGWAAYVGTLHGPRGGCALYVDWWFDGQPSAEAYWFVDRSEGLTQARLGLLLRRPAKAEITATCVPAGLPVSADAEIWSGGDVTVHVIEP